jgi:hypothetical protein
VLRRLFPNFARAWDSIDAGKRLVLAPVFLFGLCLLITAIQELGLALGMLHR